jgi:hypothetical protein
MYVPAMSERSWLSYYGPVLLLDSLCLKIYSRREFVSTITVFNFQNFESVPNSQTSENLEHFETKK